MIRRILTLICFLTATLLVNAQTWLNTLRNENYDIIDSIVVAKDDKGWADYLKMYSYHIYYHQPVSHMDPGGEQFQLRATLVVRKNRSVATTPMQVFISGYNIHEYNWNNPSYYVGQGSTNSNYFEIAEHLKANVLSLEHRYFDKSIPEDGHERMEYCTAEEAAADFHALIGAIKKVFKGKYVISGISKGGTNTFLQHAFYPDDADLYVPYVAPMCDTPDDARVMQYYKAHAWNEELRNEVNSIQKKILEDPTVYEYFRDWQKPYNPTWTETQLKQSFLRYIGLMDFDAHMKMSRAEVTTMLKRVNSMKKELMAKGYDESYLYANMAFYGTMDTDVCWQWLLNRAKTRAGDYPIPEKGREVMTPLPFSISHDVFDGSMTPYYYQAVHELGSFGFDFGAILGEDNAALANSYNKVWRKNGNNSIFVTMPYLSTVKYDGSLRDMVIDKTTHATKPIIFLFGGDDAWTGGALPDECYNNETTFRFILPEQNHSASISASSTADRKQIWSLIDDALAGKLANDIKDVVADADDAVYNLNGQKIKVMEKGKMYIRGGKKIFFR